MSSTKWRSQSIASQTKQEEEWNCSACSDVEANSWERFTTNCSKCGHRRCDECRTRGSATASSPNNTPSTYNATHLDFEPGIVYPHDHSLAEVVYLAETTASMNVDYGSTFDQVDVHRNFPKTISVPTPLESWYRNLERHELLASGLSKAIHNTTKSELGNQLGSGSSHIEFAKAGIPSDSEPSSSSLVDMDSPIAKDDLFVELTDMLEEVTSSSAYKSGTKNNSPLESFINEPESYFRGISSLEDRVLHLTSSTFKNIRRTNNQSFISLPSLEFDTTPPDYSPPFGQNGQFNTSQITPFEREKCIRNTFMASLESLSAIRGGIKLLHDEGFCNREGYSIIVVDPNRPGVLNVRWVSVASLDVLDELLREGASESPQWDPILNDIMEIISHIIISLGLNIPVIFNVLNLQKEEEWRGICQLLSALLAILHIALMSFIRSHLDMSGTIPNGALSDGLLIETPGGRMCLATRRLQCLHGLLKQPVWAFNFIPENSEKLKVDYNGFYISSSIDDLAQLWGPFRLNYSENTQTAILRSIETHGGRFIAIEPNTGQLQPLNNETLCHWSTWLDIPQDQHRLNEVEAIDTTKRLLIGMYHFDDSGNRLHGTECQGRKRRRRPKLEVLDICMCSERYAAKYGEFDLSTRPPSWKLDARTFQASGGHYFTVTIGFTYKFDAGWTLKDAILEDWLDAGKEDLAHIPNPHYMDYLVLLDISQCSGHTRRISLWKLLHCSDLRHYFRQNLERAIYEEIETALLQHSNDSFATIWPALDTNKRNVLTLAFKFVLKTLRCTGVGEDGLLQAWDITTIPRIDGRRIDPQWTALVQDDIGCATFAIVTGACKIYKPPVRAHKPSPTGLPILHTQVCITASEKLEQMNVPKKELRVPPRLDESSPHSFASRWSVPRSNLKDIKHEKFYDIGQADAEKALFEGIRTRQRARQMASDSASINRSTEQSVHREPIQPKTSPNSDETILYDDARRVLSNEIHRPKAKGKRLSEALICDANLSFRNGKGQNVGRLLLEPLEGPEQSIDLNSFSEGSSLPAIWHPNTSSSKSFSSLVQNSVGFIPRLIGRIAPVENSNPALVTEYIRPGSLAAHQRVLTLYIR